MPEDTWVYRREYRVPILGEFYSITPKALKGTLGLVKRVKLYPWNTAGISDTPEGQYGEVEPNEFPEGKVPNEDYYDVPPLGRNRERAFDAEVMLTATLEPHKL